MKTAKKRIVGVELTCPHCSEIIPAPNYTDWWTRDEIAIAGETVDCSSCNKRVRLPRL